MAKALTGIKVLEFHSNIGAAYAAMLLAEQGAEVVKVEPPGGAPERGTPHFHALNRSKRVVFLAGGADVKRTVDSLVIRNDIVITGLTPKRLQERGLDYRSLQRINPRVLAVNLSPFGDRGPDAEIDADDELVAARGGISGSQWARSGNPVALGIPLSSYSAAVMAATAAVTGLIEREYSGEGQAIEMSLLAGALALQTGNILRHDKMKSVYQGISDPLGPVPCYRLFQASDHNYLFIACGNSTFWGKFAIALDHPELVSDPRFENAPWGIPSQYWQPLKDVIEPIIRRRPRDEWLRILREADVPCAPVLTRKDFIDCAQVAVLGMRREIVDPTLGKTIQSGIPVGLIATPGGIVGPAPALCDGVNLRELFASENRADLPAKPPEAGRLPLEGIMVLDFASYIAGSYGPMIMAQLGATVIKIESLEGDAFRTFGFGFLGWNQGKRALAVNLGNREGLDIIYGLADKADVVVENLRPGRMRRFGLDYGTISKHNPSIIYMSITGFGSAGPDHNQPGFDPLLQARSGVMAAQGGPHAHPVYLTCALCDYGAAMLAAFGCVLALRARQESGRGQFCETSLLQSAMAFQAGEFIFYKDRPDLENGSPERRGRSALSRAYRARDGRWLFMSVVNPAKWNGVAEVFPALGKHQYEAASREPAEGDLATDIAAEFARLDRDDAVSRLLQIGVSATYVNNVQDLFSDQQIIANQLVTDMHHPEWGEFCQTGSLIKLSRTPARIERPAPIHGQHTDELLREFLGFDESKIADLRARGIVK